MIKKITRVMSSIMHNPMALLFLLLFLFFHPSIACIQIEKQSLLTFKESLQDPLDLLSSWTIETDCCRRWKGVACTNVSTGRVHQLHLRGNETFRGLSGQISPSLLNLKHLRYLDLSQNDFEEMIPSFIGSLTALEYLNLSSAGFYGKIPPSLSNLSNLHTLCLEYNFVDIPNLGWLSSLSLLEYLNMKLVDLGKVANWAHVINNLPSLVEVHLGSCSLRSFKFSTDDVDNTSRSNIVVLDLSSNSLLSSTIIGKWIFQLRDIIYLDLSKNLFGGSIPTVTNSTKLQYLDFSGNHFNSSIPDWLYFCKALQFVNIEDNGLLNEISNVIENLTSLNFLSLSNNEMSGKIPSQIGSLCEIRELYLGSNELQGDISISFGNMSHCFLRVLERLDLSENQLSGHLTPRFEEFTSLQTLNMQGNSLSGMIPNNIGNLSSLQSLFLDGNKLTGNLPPSIGKLSNLIGLSIEYNMLEGLVTETHFARLSKLKNFYASGNNLTLKICSDWIPPFKIETLGLGSWTMIGSRIPPWLETQKNTIQDLDLSYTGVSGLIPIWVWTIKGYLNFSHNDLHGKIPPSAGSGQYLYLSSNKLSGPLPRIGSSMFHLDLSNNLFSGGLTHVLCVSETMMDELYQLKILHLGGNHLHGHVPDCWTNWPLLTMLNLGNNNFSGKIPNSIGSLVNLVSLNLFGNTFFGGLPFSMQNCTQLVMMDLADNHFNGSMQEWPWASLSELRFLVLRSNNLSGKIPSGICKLSSLQILDLSNNRFSGKIPECVDNISAMAKKTNLTYDLFENSDFDYSYYMRTYIESVTVTMKGALVHYNTILPFVTIIDLSKNDLSSNIPKEITSLLQLISLNLSGNRLMGSIPDSIGNMKQLESLDFSTNSLSGHIPNSFTTMSSLSYLNLSCNNLMGKIPESTQILSFNESSFIGNSLCGPPLAVSCGHDGKGYESREDDESEMDEWVYVFVSLGYSVGLSSFLCIVDE